MEYKVESIETNFGKGVRIKKEERIYEQINGNDGLHIRIFRAPSVLEGKIENTDYHGVIFKPLLDDTISNYEQFKTLAERLQQVSGEEIPNSKAKFMDFIAHTGLEKQLSKIGATIKINLNNQEKFPKKTNSWLISKSHYAGLLTDLITYAGGFLLLSQFEFKKNVSRKEIYAMYGLFAPIFEFMGGMIGSAIRNHNEWCGPAHAIGYIPTEKLLKKKLKTPDYILNKFLQNYQRLDNLSASIGDHNKFAKQSKLADKHFEIIEELFPFTPHQEGFSISYDSQNREDIVSLFEYILKGGNIPKMSNSQTGFTKNKEEKIIITPTQTHFVDPWTIETPRIGVKKNE